MVGDAVLISMSFLSSQQDSTEENGCVTHSGEESGVRLDMSSWVGTMETNRDQRLTERFLSYINPPTIHNAQFVQT